MIDIDKLKKAELFILVEINKFCQENNIQYSLYAGTLLGSIRHSGFIPWDDDIDICMTRENFDIFIQKWLNKNDSRFYLDNPYDYKHSRINHAKIRLRKTILDCDDDSYTNNNERGIFVDVFPLDYLPSNYKKSKKAFRIALTRNHPPKNSNIIKKIILKVCFLILKPFRKMILKKIDKGLKKYNRNNATQISTLNELWGLSHSHSLNILDEFITGKFENYSFPIAKNYDLFLTELFGNYMELPPIEERTYKHSPKNVDYGPYTDLFN